MKEFHWLHDTVSRWYTFARKMQGHDRHTAYFLHCMGIHRQCYHW